MDIAFGLNALRLLDLTATLAIAAYLWLRRRHDRNAARIGEIEQRLLTHEESVREKFNAGDKRIALLESHLPTREQITTLAEAIAGLRAEVAALKASNALIHTHLLNSSAKTS